MNTTWATPKAFFEMLDNEFNFTVDVCALPGTAKVVRFFTPEIDGLKQDWSKEVFFMNPPYGRGQDVYSWVKKAYESAKAGGTGVCLLQLSGDTKWYHEFVMKSNEIRFVRDRIWFELDGVASRANHASIVAVFRPGCDNGGAPVIMSIPNCRTRK
jgi:site-specific DNA-methyltransferase (adenine-specific)